MDTLSHGLWGFALAHRWKFAWTAFFFGVLPDLLAFVPHFILEHKHFGKPALTDIGEYTFIMYNLTHSFVIFAIVFVLVYLITKKWFLPMLAWPLHTLMDIPTHELSFFPTPYLWPFPTPLVDGFSWAQPWFMALNIVALILVYLFVIRPYFKNSSRT